MGKKKNIISFVFLSIFLVIFLIAFCSKGTNQGVEFDIDHYNESHDNISINNLHIDAHVNRDNSINIKETFDVTFNKSGLSEVIRLVPYKSVVYRDLNGKVKKDVVASKISNIDVGGAEKTFYVDEITGTVTIGLKNHEKYKKGETQSFSISYLYSMGKDYNKDFDDIYFNIVGTNSTLTIKNVSFMVELPDELNTDNIKIYYGTEGSTNTLNYECSGNVIVGSIAKLGPTEGITLRAVYKDGYLSYSGTFGALEIISIILVCFMIGVAVYYFIKIKQRESVIVPVELTVPESLTPFTAEYLDHYECSDKSVIATIVQLANKGYLQINENKEKKIELIKKNDVPDNEAGVLKGLHEALFKYKETVVIDKIDEFFVEMATVYKVATKVKTEKKLYDQNIKKQSKVLKSLFFIGLVSLIVILFLATFNFFGFKAQFYNIKLIIFSITLLAYCCVFMMTKTVWLIRGEMLVALLFMLFYLYFGLGFKFIDGNFIYLITISVALLTSILIHGETKYSEEGSKAKGLTLGFKNFIKLCEVDQIKAFAEENPSYYFEVLPYAYVFDLTDVWIKKFETMNLNRPDWLTTECGEIADIVAFNLLFNHFTSQASINTQALNAKIAQKQFVKSSSSNFGSRGKSSGGFSGGGFSGGGRGGGGFGAR